MTRPRSVPTPSSFDRPDHEAPVVALVVVATVIVLAVVALAVARATGVIG